MLSLLKSLLAITDPPGHPGLHPGVIPVATSSSATSTSNSLVQSVIHEDGTTEDLSEAEHRDFKGLKVGQLYMFHKYP